MDCLQDYIGLKNCSITTPESGIFVNILPGINTELVDKIASSEQVNFIGVWENVKARSFLRLKNDVIMKIQEKTDFNDIVFQTKNLLPLNPDQQVVNSGSEYRGIYVKIPTTKYAEYYIDFVQVYSDTETTSVLKVFDVNDGKELFSKSIDLIVGLNNIPVDQTFSLRYGILELFIGVDCSNFNSIETYQEQHCWYDEDFDCATSQSYHGQRNYSLVIQPASLSLSSPALFANISRHSNGFGITAVSQIKCSIEAFICQNRKQLQQALLYLLGAEILAEKISSPRLNYFTGTNIEITDFTKNGFEKSYKENLNMAIKTIPLEGESFCFTCGEQMSVSTGGFMP